MSLWDQVEALLAEGKGATVTLTAAMEVKTTHRKAERRRHRERPWERWSGSTDGMSRPRCHARGCDKYLKKDQPIVCSEECHNKLRDYCVRSLALLEGVVDTQGAYEEVSHGDEVLRRVAKEV